MGEYSALLSLFNITTEKIDAELNGKRQHGLLYFALNEKGQKTSHPFKASLFGKSAGISALELHFANCKTTLKNHKSIPTIKSAINIALQSTNEEQAFKKELAEQGINVIVRRNDAGRIYGITFIDINSKTVWNGSRLGKELSANTFNDHWNNKVKSEVKDDCTNQPKFAKSSKDEDLPIEKPHQLFDFLNTDKQDESAIEIFGSLLPEVQSEDYEEIDFANKMKKKKRKRGQK